MLAPEQLARPVLDHGAIVGEDGSGDERQVRGGPIALREWPSPRRPATLGLPQLHREGMAMAARVTHLMGWTVVRVADAPDLDGLGDHLVAGAQVVLELGKDLGAEHDAMLVDLLSAADGTDVRLVVADGDARERLRGVGVRDVHESLDAAVGDEAPAEYVRPQTSHVTPFAGDTVIVTALDMRGPEEH